MTSGHRAPNFPTHEGEYHRSKSAYDRPFLSQQSLVDRSAVPSSHIHSLTNGNKIGNLAKNRKYEDGVHMKVNAFLMLFPILCLVACH